MSVYVDQAHKDNALRSLLGDLQRKAVTVKWPAGYSDTARDAYGDAATQLSLILDRAVAPAKVDVPEFGQFNTPDMSVTVKWPAGLGLMQAAVFDRNGGPEAETLTALDRVIVHALLVHAIEHLDGAS